MCAVELFQMVADDYMLNPKNAQRVEETVMLNAYDTRRSCCLVSSWDHSFTTRCLGVCVTLSHNSHVSSGRLLLNMPRYRVRMRTGLFQCLKVQALTDTTPFFYCWIARFRAACRRHVRGLSSLLLHCWDWRWRLQGALYCDNCTKKHVISQKFWIFISTTMRASWYNAMGLYLAVQYCVCCICEVSR
jgi:hypothetical protein